MKLLGWYDNADKLYIAMENFPLGDLQQHMSKTTLWLRRTSEGWHIKCSRAFTITCIEKGLHIETSSQAYALYLLRVPFSEPGVSESRRIREKRLYVIESKDIADLSCAPDNRQLVISHNIFGGGDSATIPNTAIG